MRRAKLAEKKPKQAELPHEQNGLCRRQQFKADRRQGIARRDRSGAVEGRN